MEQSNLYATQQNSNKPLGLEVSESPDEYCVHVSGSQLVEYEVEIPKDCRCDATRSLGNQQTDASHQ